MRIGEGTGTWRCRRGTVGWWDVGGNGICRVDRTAKGSAEKRCDHQSKKPTQVAVGQRRADGTYYLYVSDMSSRSIGPIRLVYDPTADTGKGGVVPNSANIVGGVHTAGFFADSARGFRSSSVALGPCDAVITTPCTALYVGFEKSKKIERINFVDQSPVAQSIETISMTNDVRKGVRYGIADFRNADGTDDLHIDEFGGEGVSVIDDVVQVRTGPVRQPDG